MSRKLHYTKSIASIDGAIKNPTELIKACVNADGIRIVSRERQDETVINTLTELRKAKELSQIPIMMDLATHSRGQISKSGDGEIRAVEYGERIKMTPMGKGGDVEIRVPDFKSFLKKDCTVFCAYGSVVLTVVEMSTDSATLEVVQGGQIFNEMDVHVPATRPSESFASIGDAILKATCDNKVEFLVLPGFDDCSELENARKHLASLTDQPPELILKVDSDKVYSRLPALLPFVDGVLISRLEMGLTIKPSMIPMLTKEIIQTCTDQAKMVFTASEMLGSMQDNATPTRAEVSDIANAVHDGADAVVLSENISKGPHFERALLQMNKIILDIESSTHANINWQRQNPAIENEMDAVSYGAYKTAERTGAKAIACITVSGNTALRLSSFRAPVPIFAVTFDEAILRRLNLVRSVSGIVINTEPNIDTVLPLVNDKLVRDSWLKSGDRIVFVSVTISSVERENSNLFTIQTLK